MTEAVDPITTTLTGVLPFYLLLAAFLLSHLMPLWAVAGLGAFVAYNMEPAC